MITQALRRLVRQHFADRANPLMPCRGVTIGADPKQAGVPHVSHLRHETTIRERKDPQFLQKREKLTKLLILWCPEGDLNPHGLAACGF